MKMSGNPYGGTYDVKVPPDTITRERSKAGGKATARFPHAPLSNSQSSSSAGKMKRAALTPDSSPTGS